MLDHNARYEAARRWAAGEVQRLATRGMAADGRMMAEVMRAAGGRDGPQAGDPWAEETTLAVIRRAALTAIERIQRSRRGPSRDRKAPALLLLGGALIAVLLDAPRAA